MTDIPLTGPEDIVDRPTQVELSPPRLAARSFLDFEVYSVHLSSADGRPVVHQRDLLRIGPVVGVLPLDPVRDEVVLIRQFRLGAQLATGIGELVEPVAGLVDEGEDALTTAARECEEEIGVTPTQLIEMLSFMPAPGFTDEHATMFLGIVDASKVPERAGLEAEEEQIQPIRVKVDDAIAALGNGKLRNGYLIHALHWLALHRPRLDEIIRAGRA